MSNRCGIVRSKGISSAVRTIVDSDPCLQEAIANKIVSYSELARRIQPAVERLVGAPVSANSIKIALTRYKPPEARRYPKRAVLDILARSTLELRSGVAVVTAYKYALRPLINALPELEGKTRMFLLLQSLNTFTLIIDEDYLDRISELIGGDIVEEYRGQSALVIVSPKELVETPGFIAYITGLLSGEGINITQIESSYTDTILVMKKQDAMRALEILLKAIDAARSQLGLK